MMLSGEGVLLRVFIGEADRHHGRPLSEVIVEAARKGGLAGATAWKGFMGFGAHSRMHTAKVLRLSTDLPVIIEIVDTREKIEGFLPRARWPRQRGARDDRAGGRAAVSRPCHAAGLTPYTATPRRLETPRRPVS